MTRATRPLVLRYGVALAVSVVALLISLLVEPALEGGPSLIFLAAVIFSAGYGGLGPGLLPTAIGCLAVLYFSDSPAGSRSLSALSPPLGALLFMLVAVLDTALNARLHRARRRAEALARHEAEAAALHQAEAAALREADRRTNEFLRTAVHELRNPLSVIYGYAELLKLRADAPEPENVKEAAEQILTGSAQLARLVEDLLDFGRIQRGEVTLEPQEFDLAPLLHDLLVGVQFTAGGERVVSELPERLPVYADRGRVAQVVSNLVENALKYAPHGPILVRATHLGHPDRTGGAVRVEVEDHGPGIPVEAQRRVWEKFFRGTEGTEPQQAPGSGIGLAVVKTLVEAQGGRVGLDSAPGKGSRFWFELPAARPPDVRGVSGREARPARPASAASRGTGAAL